MDYLACKLHQKVVFLRRNKSCCSVSCTKRIVEATFPSVLDEGDDVILQTTLKPLDSVYHSALGFIAGVGYNCQHCLLHDMIGWSSLHWFLFIFKALLGKLPPYISTMLHQYVNPYLTQSNDWFVF